MYTSFVHVLYLFSLVLQVLLLSKQVCQRENKSWRTKVEENPLPSTVTLSCCHVYREVVGNSCCTSRYFCLILLNLEGLLRCVESLFQLRHLVRFESDQHVIFGFASKNGQLYPQAPFASICQWFQMLDHLKSDSTWCTNHLFFSTFHRLQKISQWLYRGLEVLRAPKRTPPCGRLGLQSRWAFLGRGGPVEMPLLRRHRFASNLHQVLELRRQKTTLFAPESPL